MYGTESGLGHWSHAGIMERREDRTGILTHVLLFDTVPRTVHLQLHIDIFCQFASPRRLDQLCLCIHGFVA